MFHWRPQKISSPQIFRIISTYSFCWHQNWCVAIHIHRTLVSGAVINPAILGLQESRKQRATSKKYTMIPILQEVTNFSSVQQKPLGSLAVEKETVSMSTWPWPAYQLVNVLMGVCMQISGCNFVPACQNEGISIHPSIHLANICHMHATHLKKSGWRTLWEWIYSPQ